MHYIVARWTTVFCCWNAIIGFQSSLFVPLCNGWPSTMELIQNVMRRHQQQHHKHFLVHCSLLSHLHIVTYEYGVSICCPRWENIVIKLENPDMCVCVWKKANEDSQHLQYLGTAVFDSGQKIPFSPSGWMTLIICLDDSQYLFGWFSPSVWNWMILIICLDDRTINWSFQFVISFDLELSFWNKGNKGRREVEWETFYNVALKQ